jgi:hypothetical protein
MQQPLARRDVLAPAGFGVVLIDVGVVAMLSRLYGINLFESFGEGGWPVFIILPGLVLLALAVVPAPPAGIGFATSGAIVTMVGSILLYQQQTGHWESWAYAWALIPFAAGVAQVLYGLLARQRSMVSSGLWMAGIAGALFLVGAWFFEGVFAGDRAIIDAGNWWPVAVIALGAVIAFRAVVFPPTRAADPGAQPGPEAPAATPRTPADPA